MVPATIPSPIFHLLISSALLCMYFTEYVRMGVNKPVLYDMSFPDKFLEVFDIFPSKFETVRQITLTLF